MVLRGVQSGRRVGHRHLPRDEAVSHDHPRGGSAVVAGRSDEGCGEIYVLRMGKWIRMADSAREMIRLSGLGPDVDIKIKGRPVAGPSSRSDVQARD